jgi:hypothetical protein
MKKPTPYMTLGFYFVPHGYQMDVTIDTGEGDPWKGSECRDYSGNHREDVAARSILRAVKKELERLRTGRRRRR